MKYYVQRHASGYVGNCLLWWRKGGRGYTCNLDDAEVFEAADVPNNPQKYTAWEKEYIDSCAHRHVDHQYVNGDACGIRASSAEVSNSCPVCPSTGHLESAEDAAESRNKMADAASRMNPPVDLIVRKIWADNTVLCLSFRDEKESVRKGHGCSEDHGCHDIEAFLRVILEMKERGIMRAEFRISLPASVENDVRYGAK